MYCRQRRTSSRVSLVSSSLFVLFVVLVMTVVVMAHYHRRQHRANAYYAFANVALCPAAMFRQGCVYSMYVYLCGGWKERELKFPPTCDHKGLCIGRSNCVFHVPRDTKYISCLQLTVTNWAKGLDRARTLYKQRIMYGPVAIYKTMLALAEDTAIGKPLHPENVFLLLV